MGEEKLFGAMTLILLSFALLSLIGLEWGLSENGLSEFNPDEISHVNTAKDFLEVQKPDFFYVKFFPLQIAIIGFVSGVSDIHDLVILGRYLSLFYSILTLILVFAISRKFFDVKTGFISTIMLGSSLLFVNWSHQATPIMASLFWFLFSLYCINLAFEKEKIEFNVLAIITCTFCFAIQFIFIPLIFLGLLFLIKKDTLKDKIFIFVLFLLIFIGSFWLANGSLISIEDLSHTFTVIKLKGLEVISDKSILINIPLLATGLSNSMGFFALCFAMLGLFMIRSKKFVFLFVFPTLAYMLLLISKSIFLERYLLLLLPLFAISFGYYSSIIIEKKPKYFILPVVIIFISLISTVGAQTEQANDNRFEAYEWLNDNVESGETIMASKYFYGSSEYKHELDLTKKPDYVVLHEFYYGRYIKKFTSGFNEPKCNIGVHHQTSENNCLVVKGLVNGTNQNYYLVKEFDYNVYSLEGHLFKKTFGMFDVQTGKVLIFKRRTN